MSLGCRNGDETAQKPWFLQPSSACRNSSCTLYKLNRDLFPESKLYTILTCRAYIGEIIFKGQTYQGIHQPLVDLATFQRVQSLVKKSIYRQRYEHLFAGELITCGHCGGKITGEVVKKRTTDGIRKHCYYRCSRYSRPGHARIRLRLDQLEKQFLDLLAELRVDSPTMQAWFRDVLQARTNQEQLQARGRIDELGRQLAGVQQQQEKLLNLRLSDQVGQEVFDRKCAELRDRETNLRVEIDAYGRGAQENASLAVQTFELSQKLVEKWPSADYLAKRRMLEIIGLNFRLDDATLVAELRKPFDVLRKLTSVPSRVDDRT